MISAYKWRITGNTFAYLADKDNESALYIVTDRYDAAAEKEVSEIVSKIDDEDEYRKRYTAMASYIKAQYGLGMLDYTYYFDIDSGKCGVDPNGDAIAGTGIEEITSIKTDSGTSVVIKMDDMNGTEYVLTIPDGQDGRPGTDGDKVFFAWADAIGEGGYPEGDMGFVTNEDKDPHRAYDYLGVLSTTDASIKYTPSAYTWNEISGSGSFVPPATIVSITYKFAISTQGTGDIHVGPDPSTLSEDGWEPYQFNMTQEYPYLWKWTNTIYSDGSQDNRYEIMAAMGKNGGTPLMIDLSNEMDIIPGTYEGKTMYQTVRSTVATLYYGDDEQRITSDPSTIVTFSEEGIASAVITFDSERKNATIQITVEAGKEIANDKLTATIELTCNLGTVSTTMDILLVRAGENGSTPELFQILMNENAIKVDDAGGIYPETLRCEVTFYDENGMAILPVSRYTEKGLMIKYYRDGNESQKEMYDPVRGFIINHSNPSSPNYVDKSVTFLIYVNKVLYDRETVPMVIDGINSSPFIIDLTNEMGLVPANSGGTISAPGDTGATVETSIAVYFGNEIKEATVSSVTFNIESTGITYTVTENEETENRWDVTISIKNGVSFSQYQDKLTATFTMSGQDCGVVSASMDILAVRGGKDGSSPVLYQLGPSDDVIRIDSNNNKEPTGLTCSVLKIVDGEYTSGTPKSFSADGIYVKYIMNGSGTERSYTGGTINTSGINKSIKFTLYYTPQGSSNRYIYDTETIPVVADGKNAITTLLIDLDNEMDLIGGDENGVTIYDTTIETKATLFFSGDAIDVTESSITFSDPHALDKGINTNGTVYDNVNKCLNVCVNIPSGITISNDKLDVTITLGNSTHGTLSANLPIQLLRGGKNGENPLLFQIRTSDDVIKVDSVGAKVPTGITCSIFKTEGNQSGEMSYHDAKVAYGSDISLKYSIDGRTYTEYDPGSTPQVIQTSGINNKIKFRLTYRGITYDNETIPVIADGKNGNGFLNLVLDKTIDSVRIDDTGHPMYDKTINVMLRLIGTDGEPMNFLSADEIEFNDFNGSAGTIPSHDNVSSITITYHVSKTGTTISNETILSTITVKHGDCTVISTFTLIGEKAGEAGKMYYFAGEWDASETYTITDHEVPYVQYGDEFYMLDGQSGTSSTGDNPETSDAWIRMTSENKYYIAEAIFSDFAKLGSGVFSKDYMLSQYGTWLGEPDTTEYNKFNADAINSDYLFTLVNETPINNITAAGQPIIGYDGYSAFTIDLSKDYEYDIIGNSYGGDGIIDLRPTSGGNNLLRIEFSGSSGEQTFHNVLSASTNVSTLVEVAFYQHKNSGAAGTAKVYRMSLKQATFYPNLYIDWFTGSLVGNDITVNSGLIKDVTIGATRNLITTITDFNYEDYGQSGIMQGTHAEYLIIDPAKVGNIILWNCSKDIMLPGAWVEEDEDSGATIGFTGFSDIDYALGCVGKKMTIFNIGNGSPKLYPPTCGMIRTTNGYINNGGDFDSIDVNGQLLSNYIDNKVILKKWNYIPSNQFIAGNGTEYTYEIEFKYWAYGASSVQGLRYPCIYPEVHDLNMYSFFDLPDIFYTQE